MADLALLDRAVKILEDALAEPKENSIDYDARK